MTTVETLTELIIQRQAALDAEALIRAQIDDLDKSTAEAGQKIDEIKTNDSADISGLARQLSEHQAVIELAAGRRARLQEQLQAAKSAVSQKRYEIEATVKPAMSAVLGYRKSQRIRALQDYIAGWISPQSVSGFEAPWLRQAILNLSAHDRNLDAVSFITGAGTGGYSRTINTGDAVSQAQDLIALGPEIEKAEQWQAADQQRRAETYKGNPNRAYHEVEHIRLYAK